MEDKVQLQIEIRIFRENQYPGLNFSQSSVIQAGSFQDLAKIMSRFHDLFTEIASSHRIKVQLRADAQL